MSNLIAVGEKAPDFTLPVGDGNFNGAKFTLSEMKGKHIVFAFYPADWSAVCGSQIALYNELVDSFEQYNAELIGISVDGTFCHKAYKENNNISLRLLCDFEPKGAVSKLYHAYHEKLGVCERAIYVIDKNGIVQYSYLSPMGENPGAKEILETLKKLNA